MGSKPIDLTGMVFGKLTVLSKAEDTYTNSGIKKINWNCICECGNTCIARSSSLLCGDRKSCGCLKSEQLRNRNKKKHGDSQNSRLYKIWAGMKNRCNCESHHEYYRYGGRGISVCEEWNEYINFKKWALNSGYSKEKSIDRINNDIGYSPENCRWSNNIEQSNNRSTNVLVTYNSETKLCLNGLEKSE